MDQNKKIVINIDCSSKSNFSNLLIEALQMCNNERDLEINRALQLNSKLIEGKSKLAAEEKAHGETKDKLAAEEKAHGETKGKLAAEEKAHGETKEKLAAEEKTHGVTKDKLAAEEKAHGETKEKLAAEEKAHGETKDKLVAEEKAHGETKDKLAAEQKAHTATSEKLNQLSNSAISKIKLIFDEIAIILKEHIENEHLAKFVSVITKTDDKGNYAWSDCEDTESFLYKCKFETSFFSRIASLVWWNEQEGLKYMTACISRINDIQPLVSNAVSILEVFGHTITFPTGPMTVSIHDYSPYDNEPSNFIRIFTAEKLENKILCEVRQLAIDGQKGELFIYYK